MRETQVVELGRAFLLTIRWICASSPTCRSHSAGAADKPSRTRDPLPLGQPAGESRGILDGVIDEVGWGDHSWPLPSELVFVLPLAGPIPSGLGNLAALQRLVLSYNELSGELLGFHVDGITLSNRMIQSVGHKFSRP